MIRPQQGNTPRPGPVPGLSRPGPWAHGSCLMDPLYGPLGHGLFIWGRCGPIIPLCFPMIPYYFLVSNVGELGQQARRVQAALTGSCGQSAFVLPLSVQENNESFQDKKNTTVPQEHSVSRPSRGLRWFKTALPYCHIKGPGPANNTTKAFPSHFGKSHKNWPNPPGSLHLLIYPRLLGVPPAPSTALPRNSLPWYAFKIP